MNLDKAAILRHRTAIWVLGILAALIFSLSHGDSKVPLSVDRIFHDKEFELNEPVSSKWLADGDSYTTIEKST